jgi:hypothetical protein
MSNPYQPPASVTRATPSRVEVVLSQQSVVGAIFGGALGAFIGVAVWMMAVILTHDNSSLMALTVAVFVGVLVRFNGRGLTARYRLIAAAFAWLGAVAGIWFTGYSGMPVFMFFAAGGIAAALARRSLDRDTEKSLWRLQRGIAEETR